MDGVTHVWHYVMAAALDRDFTLATSAFRLAAVADNVSVARPTTVYAAMSHFDTSRALRLHDSSPLLLRRNGGVVGVGSLHIMLICAVLHRCCVMAGLYLAPPPPPPPLPPPPPTTTTNITTTTTATIRVHPNHESNEYAHSHTYQLNSNFVAEIETATGDGGPAEIHTCNLQLWTTSLRDEQHHELE